MRNRQSFQKQLLSNQQFSTNLRRKSCECSECGLRNPKMQYYGAMLTPFLPYQLINAKNVEQKLKMQQQKQLKMRNKRHQMLKKAVNVIKVKEFVTKTLNLRQSISQQLLQALPTPSTANPQQSAESQLPPSKQPSPSKRAQGKRTTMLNPPVQRLKKPSFRNFLTLPLPSQQVATLIAIIDKQIRVKRGLPVKDDFEHNARITEEEEAAKKPAPPPPPPVALEPVNDMSESDNSQELPPPIKIQPCKRPVHTYRDILKYNKRSLANIIEQGQLTQSKTIQHLFDRRNNHLDNRKFLSNENSPAAGIYQHTIPSYTNPFQENRRNQVNIKLQPLSVSKRKIEKPQEVVHANRHFLPGPVTKGKHVKLFSSMIIKL